MTISAGTPIQVQLSNGLTVSYTLHYPCRQGRISN